MKLHNHRQLVLGCFDERCLNVSWSAIIALLDSEQTLVCSILFLLLNQRLNRYRAYFLTCMDEGHFLPTVLTARNKQIRLLFRLLILLQVFTISHHS